MKFPGLGSQIQIENRNRNEAPIVFLCVFRALLLHVHFFFWIKEWIMDHSKTNLVKQRDRQWEFWKIFKNILWGNWNWVSWKQRRPVSHLFKLLLSTQSWTATILLVSITNSNTFWYFSRSTTKLSSSLHTH